MILFTAIWLLGISLILKSLKSVHDCVYIFLVLTYIAWDQLERDLRLLTIAPRPLVWNFESKILLECVPWFYQYLLRACGHNIIQMLVGVIEVVLCIISGFSLYAKLTTRDMDEMLFKAALNHSHLK